MSANTVAPTYVEGTFAVPIAAIVDEKNVDMQTAVQFVGVRQPVSNIWEPAPRLISARTDSIAIARTASVSMEEDDRRAGRRVVLHDEPRMQKHVIDRSNPVLRERQAPFVRRLEICRANAWSTWRHDARLPPTRVVVRDLPRPTMLREVQQAVLVVPDGRQRQHQQAGRHPYPEPDRLDNQLEQHASGRRAAETDATVGRGRPTPARFCSAAMFTLRGALPKCGRPRYDCQMMTTVRLLTAVAVQLWLGGKLSFRLAQSRKNVRRLGGKSVPHIFTVDDDTGLNGLMPR